MKKMIDDNGRKFPIYKAKYVKNDGSVKWVDVTLALNIRDEIAQCMGKTGTELDMEIRIAEESDTDEDKEKATAFFTAQSKKNEKGKYVKVKDENGKSYTKLVIKDTWTPTDVLPYDIEFPIVDTYADMF